MDPRCDRRRQPDYSLLPLFIFIFNMRRFAHSLTHHVAIGEMKRRGVRSDEPMVKAQAGRRGVRLDKGKIKNRLRGMMRPRQKEITLRGGMSQI